MKPKTSACLAALVLGGAVALATPASAQRWHRWGGPLGAGAAGLAAGAVIGGAVASSPYAWGPGYYGGYYGYEPDYYAYEPGYAAGPSVTVIEGESAGGGSDAYCMQRFKSYDPSSGTYLGYDGMRHPCP